MLLSVSPGSPLIFQISPWPPNSAVHGGLSLLGMLINCCNPSGVAKYLCCARNSGVKNSGEITSPPGNLQEAPCAGCSPKALASLGVKYMGGFGLVPCCLKSENV